MDFRSKILSREKELESRASGIARSVIATLNGREDDLAKEIRARVGWIAERGYDSSPLSLKRLEVGLVSIGDVLAESYKDAGRDLRARLQQTGLQEIERQRELLAITGRDIKTPDTSAVKAILGEQSFRGGRLTDWLGKLLDSSTFRVSGAIRQGLAAGLLVDGIVRAVLGTKGKQWRDGVMEPGRNDMAKLVPSAVNHVTRKAREETWQLNSGIVEALEWVAVVDGAKCPLDPSCQDRAGLLYAVNTHEPVDHSIPWLEGPGVAHWNCRCVSVPVIREMEEAA